ncbi:unnamed protein product [Sphenostylis stenocarpa]|uniref:Uncharacterized protein n=1 Tax=Sphenostylis stenocarpa TaxID=92480 RepID=A0AA86W155_9FABA|nr:unnamed protein product [Sphenostylis stenocarpa]
MHRRIAELNTEDEILKAAVMKYGKNQWARISSCSQIYQAMQSWLTEWTREEDEKKLLDAACVKDENYEPGDDPRKLRLGEIDTNPESKPAHPDPVDMDEDEKEMLSEARPRQRKRKRKGIDYNAEIPFEKRPPPGFLDLTDEDRPVEQPQFPTTIEELGGKRRVDIEAQLRKQDIAKNKIAQRQDAPSANLPYCMPTS